MTAAAQTTGPAGRILDYVSGIGIRAGILGNTLASAPGAAGAAGICWSGRAGTSRNIVERYSVGSCRDATSEQQNRRQRRQARARIARGTMRRERGRQRAPN